MLFRSTLNSTLPTKYTKNGVAILEADNVEFRVDSGILYEVSNN